jgi:hypothetical protein
MLCRGQLSLKVLVKQRTHIYTHKCAMQCDAPSIFPATLQSWSRFFEDGVSLLAEPSENRPIIPARREQWEGIDQILKHHACCKSKSGLKGSVVTPST